MERGVKEDKQVERGWTPSDLLFGGGAAISVAPLPSFPIPPASQGRLALEPEAVRIQSISTAQG